jgi:Flp pilus assembly protein TadD
MNSSQTAVHEYGHYLLQTNFPPVPSWWEEGFADYYSTIQIEKKQFIIGTAPEGYADLLERGLMPMGQLLSATNSSREYNEAGRKRGIFYAQSWLFVHYLFSNKLLDQTSQYFDLTMNRGEVPAAAVQKAYGRTLKELEIELKNYLVGKGEGTYTLPAALGIEKESYDTRKLPPMAVKATFADMHLNSRDHQQAAEQEFREILEELPESSEAHRGLGYLLMRKQHFGEAAKEFGEAAELGSRDPNVFYYGAFSLYKSSKDLQKDLVTIGNHLDKAVQLDPDYAEAYNLKAIVLAKASNTGEAIRLLRRAVQLQPRNEEYKLNLAYQLMTDRRFDEADALLEQLRESANPSVAESARKQAETSQRWRKSPLMQSAELSREKMESSQWSRKPGDPQDPEADQLQSAQIDETTEADKRPIKFARGTLLASQCSDSGPTLIRARIGKRTMKLHAKDHRKILMVNRDKFDCAWKNRAVAINYREISPAEGDLFSIEVK